MHSAETHQHLPESLSVAVVSVCYSIHTNAQNEKTHGSKGHDAYDFSWIHSGSAGASVTETHTHWEKRERGNFAPLFPAKQ